MCPRCLKQTLVDHDLGKQCEACKYLMERVTLHVLQGIYFRMPMKMEDGFVVEGDHTNWEFFWAIVKYLTTTCDRDMWVAGWADDGLYVIKGTNVDGNKILYTGSTPEEAVEQMMRGVLHEEARSNAPDQASQQD
jgi:hypothetical protein